MIWVVFMARTIKCPFCGTVFRVRDDVSNTEAEAWLETTHVVMHAETLERAAYEPIPKAPDCARCQRYAKEAMPPDHRLHRPCYEPQCSCDCSYPAKENA